MTLGSGKPAPGDAGTPLLSVVLGFLTLLQDEC